ncbi:DUF547 domain-containing protein [Alkalimarinus alittae]|uniref:DUF547 domain-containing protein n=1 Tax=Alkalimarinus alittae TaxID=2961619 RepID=A0ABY6N6T4_9ALTE|nr:DUF547 domain-containing protein [Alkalimarinus alittae]UZE97699.1 DUF547 domain-containing protein [Alkalimarinus alittae]
MNNKLSYFFVLVFSLGSCVLAAQPLDHQLWDTLLKKHVVVIKNGSVTQVDYAGFQKDHVLLQRYLDSLAGITQQDFDAKTANSQLAILINLYNAATIELILTEYPNLASIKELGSFFRSPWKKTFISAFNKNLSLDEVEHDLIRGSGRYNDPRIHFAVNCASIGCPALRAEAYTAEKLQAQLDEQTRLFLADNTRNRLSGDELQVSSIFKWYQEDFEKGWNGIDALEAFFVRYSNAIHLAKSDVEKLKRGDISIAYLEYDWRLNKK